MGSGTASNSSADERAAPRRLPGQLGLLPPPSSRLLSCLVLCTPFLSTVQTPYPAPHRPAPSRSGPQAAPSRPTTWRVAHTVFTRRVFVVWVFSFVCLQLLVLKPPTLRQRSQKESKRERKGERKKAGKTRCLSANHVRRPRVSVVGPCPACPHRRQLVQGPGTIRGLSVGVGALHPRALLPVVTGEVGGV